MWPVVIGLSVDGASIVNMANDDEPVDVPARYSRVDPWVICSDTYAEIDFLTSVFEGKETPGSRMLGPTAESTTSRWNSAML
jgi:hypothetical protein